jgi:uridine kinase
MLLFSVKNKKIPTVITAEKLVENLIQEIGSPFRLRITGFPACGKTTISKFVQRRIPKIAHLESEAWMYSLNYRKDRNLSGSHPDGYEIERAVKEIRSFLQGKSITIQHYDHRIGDRIDGSVVAPEPGAPVILDGTPFSFADFDNLVPACIFLQPASLEEWLKASIRRDVETRFFSKAEATRHNMRKAKDMELVLKRSPKARVVACHIPSMLYDFK